MATREYEQALMLECGFRPEWSYDMAVRMQHLVNEISFATREDFETSFRRFASEFREPSGLVEALWLREKFGNLCSRAGAILHASEGAEHRCSLQLERPWSSTWAMQSKTPRFLLRLWLARFLRVFDTEHKSGRAPRIAYMLRHRPGAMLSVTKMARKTGCSSALLIRIFTERYGLTPTAYHTRVRLRAAVRRLRAGDLKVEYVARKAGYRSVGNFYNALRKHTGLTPRSVRELQACEIERMCASALEIDAATLVRRLHHPMNSHGSAPQSPRLRVTARLAMHN